MTKLSEVENRLYIHGWWWYLAVMYMKVLLAYVEDRKAMPGEKRTERAMERSHEDWGNRKWDNMQSDKVSPPSRDE